MTTSRWRRFWRDLLGLHDEFSDMDAIVEEHEYIRGVEVTHRINYRLLRLVEEARKAAP